MPWVLSDYRSEVLRLRNDGAEGAESGEGVARDADGLGEAAATAAGDDRDPTAGTEGVEQGAGSGAVAGASARSGGEDGATFRDLSKPVGALNPSRLESLRRVLLGTCASLRASFWRNLWLVREGGTVL